MGEAKPHVTTYVVRFLHFPFASGIRFWNLKIKNEDW